MGVQQCKIDSDEDGMRLDRWFKTHFPHLTHGALQKLLRTGQVRLDGKRATSDTRIHSGQIVRVPPLPQQLEDKQERPLPRALDKDRADLKAMTLFEDDDILVINKPMGLASQGGSGLKRHVDGMLEALRDHKGQKPRIIHRLDRDTSGVMIIAKRRSIAAQLGENFRSRSVKKIYWALVRGVPSPRQGKISTFLTKDERTDGESMRIATQGEDGAIHAVSYYNVVDNAGQKLSWVSLHPVTGRTHQLRAHMAHIGCPIIGDPKYFNVENWDLPGGLQNKLHLLARRLIMEHPRGGTIDVSAPLPPHMKQSWSVLGLSEKDYLDE